MGLVWSGKFFLVQLKTHNVTFKLRFTQEPGQLWELQVLSSHKVGEAFQCRWRGAPPSSWHSWWLPPPHSCHFPTRPGPQSEWTVTINDFHLPTVRRWFVELSISLKSQRSWLRWTSRLSTSQQCRWWEWHKEPNTNLFQRRQHKFSVDPSIRFREVSSKVFSLQRPVVQERLNNWD